MPSSSLLDSFNLFVKSPSPCARSLAIFIIASSGFNKPLLVKKYKATNANKNKTEKEYTIVSIADASSVCLERFCNERSLESVITCST